MEGKEMKKTLYKSRKDRFLFGVCGGLAEYFEVDPTLVRILTAALCTTGTGLLLYIVAGCCHAGACRVIVFFLNQSKECDKIDNHVKIQVK